MSMKRALRELFLETLEAVAVGRALRQRVTVERGVLEVDGERVWLDEHRRVVVVAMGKAAAGMAAAAGDLLAGQRIEGLVVGPEAPAGLPEGLRGLVGGHPYPDAGSLAAADAILALLEGLDATDVVLFLLSGGGSALVEKPLADTVTLEDCRALHETLVTCGAGIVAMNVLRKHLSAVKGGRLGVRAAPARQLTLYVCDVPSGEPSAVASGPTMPDPATTADCYDLVERLDLLPRLPESVRSLFRQRALVETPKPGDPAFDHSSWHCLLRTEDGVEEFAARARAREWAVETSMEVDEWPVERAVDALLARLERLRAAHPGRPAAVVTGGELSCPVTGTGRGGRNQAFVLACARRIAGRDVAVLSAGTDGIDGNSPAAGALADGTSVARAQARSLDPLDHARRSDSHAFFHALGDTLVLGQTGNNIRDIRALVAW